MPAPRRANYRGPLHALVAERIDRGGGWLPFDRYMALALYEPGLGYYARPDRAVFGADFVTAPELSPLFGRALARQAVQALDAADADTVFEFGAGSGRLAAQLLDAAGGRIARYAIVELSGTLRAQQQERLARFGSRVAWLDRLPDAMRGVVVGNEVLDAMPVTLLARADDGGWRERGVALADDGGFAWADRPTALRPPNADALPPGTVTEVHPQALAFVRTLAERLERGLVLFVDYGFPEHEYYHPQRTGGTLACHRGHRVDHDPLQDPGDKDITAHVDFSAVALAGQDAGLDVLGYTSQARLLVNCGLLDLLAGADPRVLAPAQKLLAEHEMGELFKAVAFGRGLQAGWVPLGFAAGDRMHTL